MRDLKYTAGYIIPLLCVAGLLKQGFWTYGSFVFAFVMVPLFEPIMTKSSQNLEGVEIEHQSRKKIFDWLLYLNLPVLWGIIALFLFKLMTYLPSAFELTGMILSVGVVIGACGINVGHELGHRPTAAEQTLAKLLLLPALYMHFFIEHNRGHHKYVATDRDPASARQGQNLYSFWIRSFFGSYRSAWQLEADRLSRRGISFWSIHNQMLVFQIIQLIYVTILYLIAGSMIFWPVLLSALVGILFLETINYIEHYGLRRESRPDGRYERVRPRHSWNSNHELGRIILYELTRHSDHHFIASKKYQLLDHHEESPQLPFGYPGSMLLSMIPPLWFRIMDPALEEFNRNLPVTTGTK